MLLLNSLCDSLSEKNTPRSEEPTMAGLLQSYFCKCLLFVILLMLGSRTRLVESSRSCASQESTDLKAYRSPIVVEGEILDDNGASVRIKVKRDNKKHDSVALKGDRIRLIGFGSLANPCVDPMDTFNRTDNYVFYIETTKFDNLFQLTGNPDKATRTVRKVVKSTVKNGSPPRLASRAKPLRKLEQGAKFVLKCSAIGLPLPDITWNKDGEPIGHRMSGVRIKTRKKKKGKMLQVELRIKKVRKTVHEGSYTCVVNNHVDPPILSNTTLAICALPCGNGELNVKRCSCQCSEGWRGESCDLPVCVPSDCGGGGTVDEESCLCQCNEDYILRNGTCISASAIVMMTTDTPGSCRDDWPCLNGGICRAMPDADGGESYQCSCPENLTGRRCETLLCDDACEHGTLNTSSCLCQCDEGYTGKRCNTRQAPPGERHNIPCNASDESYCMNGGTCFYTVQLQQLGCRCPIGYQNSQRCQILDLESPCQQLGDSYCLNGGTCSHVISENRVECMCLPAFERSPRCRLRMKESGTKEAEGTVLSLQKNSRKIVICISVIFVTLLIILAVLLLAYFKNKRAREEDLRERRDQLEQQFLAKQNSAAVSRPTNFSLATVPAIEMKQYRRPSAPPRYQSDGDLKTMQGRYHSRSVDGRIGSYSNGSLQRTISTPNGHTRQLSQGSLQFARSPSERSGSIGQRSASVGQKPKSRSPEGRASPLEKRPTPPKLDETAEEAAEDSVEATVGDVSDVSGPLPIAEEVGSIPDEKMGFESMGESGNGSPENGEGDRVDDLNPQLEALRAHPALIEEEPEETEESAGEYSDLGYPVGYAVPSPKRVAAPHRTPRNRLQGSASPATAGYYGNPMETEGLLPYAMAAGAMAAPPPPPGQTIDMRDENGYYAQRLRDIVENSPPSAV